MKSIGIIGRGFVGTAVMEGMRHAFEVYSWDKATGWVVQRPNQPYIQTHTPVPVTESGDIDPYAVMMLRVDGPIFVCVPTPMNPDGSCNTSIVEDVVGKIAEAADRLQCHGVVVVIKSTVIPGTTLKLNRRHSNIHVCFNPEFLTERNFVQDFKNQDRIIVGGPHEGTAVLKQMYETAYPSIPVTKTSSEIAEMVKYMTNCFLAVKVSFANEFAEICDKMDVDYDKVIEYATKDKRLGMSHWAVPGPDGKKGFSGSCFPKDLNAIMKMAENLNVECPTMNGAWSTNLHVRPDKDWEQLKGRAVVDPLLCGS
jgi:UDPglucose 6-dehydrogenase